MLRRTLALVVTNVALGGAVVVGATAPASAAPEAAAVVTLTYDDSRAPEYRDAIAKSASIWSEKAPNVKIVKASSGQRANITYISDPGWPRATIGPVRPSGSVTVWMGKQAVDEGHDVTRIATHETGHSLGLPDKRTGLCEDLMSGASAGTSCKNPIPNAKEIAAVQASYRSGAVQQANGQTVVD